MTLFEHETEQIISAARQRTVANAPAIAVKELLASDIPHPLKTYFRTYVQTLLEDELEQHRSASRFNIDHPEVQSLQMQINSILIMQYALKQEEFLRLLGDAVHLIINYLVRPQWTMANYIFSKGESVQSHVLFRMLRYFDSYEYLKGLLRTYVQQRHVLSLTEKEFTQTIWRLDAEYVKRKNGSDLANLIKPLYDFLSYPSKSESYMLPVKGVIKYYEDKGMTGVVQRLTEEESRGNGLVDQPGLARMLEEIEQTPNGLAVKETWTEEAAAAQEPAATPSEEPAGEKSTPNAFMSVEAYIDDGDRKKFIKKIFRHSENAYLESIGILDNLSNWKEASVYIDETFIRYGVDPYSAEAERFLEIVRERFYATK